MSTTTIFGSWDERPSHGSDFIGDLWHFLAAQNVGKSDFQPNSGLSQRRHEITMLWELYRRAAPKVVVEIGVAQGGTFAAWCVLGRPDATLIGIDRCVDDCRPRQGDQISPHIVHHPVNRSTTNGGGMYALGRNNQIIKPINGWSHSPAVMEELLLILQGRKIDWLWHDASHEAGMARRDFDLYWPLVAEGGVAAFHDIQPSAVPECNKSEWWAEARARTDYSACMEFLGAKGDDSMGIGVLIR